MAMNESGGRFGFAQARNWAVESTSLVVAAHREGGELGESVGEPGRAVRQDDEAVLDRGRLRMQAHDIVGRQVGVDPLLPFKIGPMNGREARESGLRLKAWVAPSAFLLALVSERELLRTQKEGGD
jgi:hypothetical protein